MPRVGDRPDRNNLGIPAPQLALPPPPDSMVVSLVNGGSGSSETGAGAGYLGSVLACYLCGELFRKPRILPCGHTFCSDCLARQRDFAIREARLSRNTTAPLSKSAPAVDHDSPDETAPPKSSLDRRHTGQDGGRHRVCDRRQHTPDLGQGHGSFDKRSNSSCSSEACYFYCPVPECNYSLRVMNLGRWTTRNKTVMEAVSAYRRQQSQKQDASTQTDLTLNSVLVAIPRSLVSRARHVSERHSRSEDRGSFVDNVMHRALSMDSVSHSYIPPGHFNWRSAVAMIGFNVLQQIINI